MFSPRLLQGGAVPVYKLLQHEGEFVITFPRAFHGGFSLGPNVGEAVNFATHDWIAYGSDANERYRSFARPAVFSHDRLSFTMANHLREQKAYSTCKLLLDEIERIVSEELRLRKKLKDSGVRNVSEQIQLPRNRLDQLDKDSADYDDKRLCHACKHVCFFAAVACECSQSKVSCLRHSHYMCRCPMDKRYFMIWSDEGELKSTLQRVRDHCSSLQKFEAASSLDADDSGAEADEPSSGVAPGVEQDLENHKNDNIHLDPVPEDFLHTVDQKSLEFHALNAMNSKKLGPAGPPAQPAAVSPSMVRRVSHDAAAGGGAASDDEVEFVGVKPSVVGLKSPEDP